MAFLDRVLADHARRKWAKRYAQTPADFARAQAYANRITGEHETLVPEGILNPVEEKSGQFALGLYPPPPR